MVHSLLNLGSHLPIQVTQLILESADKLVGNNLKDKAAKTKFIKQNIVTLVSQLQTFIKGMSDDDIREGLDKWTTWQIENRQYLPGLGSDPTFPQTFSELEARSAKEAGDLLDVYGNFVGALSARAYLFRITDRFGKKDIDFTVQGLSGFYDRLLFHEYVRRRIQRGYPYSSANLREAYQNFDNEIQATFGAPRNH